MDLKEKVNEDYFFQLHLVKNVVTSKLKIRIVLQIKIIVILSQLDMYIWTCTMKELCTS